MHFPQIHGGLSVTLRSTRPPKAPPLGELAGASPTERARLLTENHRHCDSIALTKSLPIAAPAALSRRACPLRHCFAMPPLPKGEALAGRKAQKIPHGGRNSLGDFSLPEMKALGSHISVFIICDSPQKSSTAQKVYKRLRGQGPSLYNLSVSLRSTAPLVGEPLAKPFTLRGLPKPPLPGEVARRRRDGEVVRRKACPRTRPVTERFTPKRYSLYTDTSLVYPESMIK